MVKKLGEKSEFVEVDINNINALEASLQGNVLRLFSFL